MCLLIIIVIVCKVGDMLMDVPYMQYLKNEWHLDCLPSLFVNLANEFGLAEGSVISIQNVLLVFTVVISQGLAELRGVTNNASEIIRNFTDNAVGQDGYIDEGRDAAQNGFNFVRQYDTPRYGTITVMLLLAIATLISFVVKGTL